MKVLINVKIVEIHHQDTIEAVCGVAVLDNTCQTSRKPWRNGDEMIENGKQLC